ncbi:MAG: hypothetical protein J6A07_01290, partial [Firmicutes bacterium]|nr:hypothetical protein [Bacillota bacterium]
NRVFAEEKNLIFQTLQASSDSLLARSMTAKLAKNLFFARGCRNATASFLCQKFNSKDKNE